MNGAVHRANVCDLCGVQSCVERIITANTDICTYVYMYVGQFLKLKILQVALFRMDRNICNVKFCAIHHLTVVQVLRRS